MSQHVMVDPLTLGAQYQLGNYKATYQRTYAHEARYRCFCSTDIIYLSDNHHNCVYFDAFFHK